MLQLTNDRFSLHVSENASRVVLTDLRRNAQWRLESPLQAGAAALRQGDCIIVRYLLPQGQVEYQWELRPDHVAVTLGTEVELDGGLPLPGALVPLEGRGEMAIPLYQGLLVRPSGKIWQSTVGHGGHNGFSLCMAVACGPAAGLLVTHDSPVNWLAHFGETAAGLFFYFQHQRCPVEGWAGATVRIFPVDRNLTAACKTYRRLLQSRGQFVTWQQKMAQRPMVKRIFGSLMAFVGYNQTGDIDYAAGARQLREYGFESVLYYPLRMCHYSLDFKMGGDDPIWLSDEQLAQVRAVEGALAGPWGWTFEALDDGSAERRGIFRHDKDGPVAGWKIDQHQWYQVCTPYQVEHITKRLATDMRMMDWIHYDVNASVPGACCQAAHAAHGGQPMSSREDLQWTRRLFSAETVGNRIVASEGFTDHNTPWYDIGSTKMMPPINEDRCFVPVPMTMLVFHDSCAHAWWEIHNYNALPGFPIEDLANGVGSIGAGLPRLKAAMDALSGSAPHVFPFGRQYGWVDFAKRLSFSFIIRLDDAPVQEALAAALPVARLHKSIGPLEMLDHALLSDDGSVQTTLFSDGTRIVANLSRMARDAGPWGTLPGYSWREVKGGV